MCVAIITEEKEVIKVRVRKQERDERDGTYKRLEGGQAKVKLIPTYFNQMYKK